jgi:hypothetical protein
MTDKISHSGRPDSPDEYLLPQSLRDDKVTRGKDGWLFLANDSNEVLLQHAGKLRFSDAQLRQWRFLLENRIAWLGRRGVPYHFLVPPNAHSVFPEKLPDSVVVEAPRPVLQLLDHLERQGSYARVIYPAEELAARKDEAPYSPTNSHWTDRGAFIAYQRLMDEISDAVAVRRLGEGDVEFVDRVFRGGLGMKMEPPEESMQPYAVLGERRSRVVHDNRVFLNGHRIELECEAAPRTTCLVHGDSYSNMLLPFLAESFGRVVFGHIPTLDHCLVDEVRPDVVVGVHNERFLIQVPVDVPSDTLEELAEIKRERGDYYAPGASRGDRWESRGRG